MRNLQLQVELLESRCTPALSGAAPSPVYLNPTLLTNAFEPAPIETTTNLFAIDQQYGLATQVVSHLEWKNYHENWGGLNEKWLRGADGSWYYLLPQGNLYRWQSDTAPLQGTLIARLGQSVVSPALATQLTQLDQANGFRAVGNYYENWGTQSEKWFKDNSGAWHYIVPDGKVYRWNHGSFPLQGTLIADFGVGEPVVTDSKVYQFPSFLTNADGGSPVETSADPFTLDQEYGFFFTGSLFENWGGRNERWIRGADDNWYFMLPHGGVYRWQGQTGPLRGTLIALVDPAVHDNPFALTDPPPPAPALPTDIQLLTSLNRTHVSDATAAGMSGGWSPHARGLMRAPDGSLWFTADYATSFWTNLGTRYFRHNPSTGAWELMGETRFFTGARQNAASILRGDVIYSYALNENSGVVQESFFSTTDATQRGTRIIHTGTVTRPAAGYVGAAVAPNGTRIVWWSEYANSGPGTFIYLYNTGSGWSAPITATLPTNRFSYAHAVFTSNSHLILGGELFDWSPAAIYRAAIAEVVLGQPLAVVASLYAANGETVRSMADLWVNPANGDIHALAETDSPPMGDEYTRELQPRRLLYFHKPASSTWSGHNVAIRQFDHTYRGRILVSADNVYIIRGLTFGDGLRIHRIATSTLTGAIDWIQTPEFSVDDLPLGQSIVNAIWVESPTYQTTATQGLDFVITGNWPTQDKYLWHITIR